MSHNQKVLIVDNDLTTRENLKIILQSQYKVSLVEDGKKALEKVYRGSFDLVTIDLQVSNPKGIELVKAIKDYDSDIEIIIITANTDLKTAIDALHYGVFDYLSKPFNMTELISVVNAAAQKRQLNLKLKSIFNELNALRETKRSLPHTSLLNEDEVLIKIAHKICYQYFSENNREDNHYSDYLRFVRILASTLESKDPYTHGHSERVSFYSSLVGEGLALEAKQNEELRIAAYLHDIGKIGVSDKLVCKRETLTMEEWSLIKEHPEKGVNLICCLKTSRNIISYVRHHHERFDGKGYPYGLAGEDIPLGGRIIAIADAYDAMISDRPYRRALLPENAKKELHRCAGRQFDPNLVRLFLDTLHREEKKNTEENGTDIQILQKNA